MYPLNGFKNFQFRHSITNFRLIRQKLKKKLESNYVFRRFLSNLTEISNKKFVSSQMMLLVPMRELDIVPKVLVPHSSCPFWITSWSLPALSYYLPWCVSELNYGFIIFFSIYMLHMPDFNMWPLGCCDTGHFLDQKQLIWLKLSLHLQLRGIYTL